MNPINETGLIIFEMTSGLSSIDMTKYVKIAFLLIGILLMILVIQLIISGIKRG